MKKTISVFIVLQLIFGMVISASASGEYYANFLPESTLTSKAFLSETTAGTITNATYPDFFMGNGKGKAYAISKESIDSMLTDGVLIWKGIPFNVKTLDNQKSAMGSTSNKIPLTTGYYSKIHVLVVGSADGTGDNTIYRGILGPDTSGETSMSRIATEYVADLAWAKVTADDNLTGKQNPKLMVETFEISDKTKRFNKVSLWLQSDASKRILAVTAEGLSGNEWKPVIEAKIAKLPESSASELFDVAAYEEIGALLEKAKATGADINAITGIQKYNNIKNELESKMVKVDGFVEVTDSEKIKLDINFTTSIAESSVVKGNFEVTSKGEDVSFEIEPIKTDDAITGVRVIMDNTLNYSEEIKVLVSKDIKNGEDEKFSLSEDYEIVFKPTAPSVYIKDVKNVNDKITVTLANNDTENAQSYALTIGLYGNDNLMKDSRVFAGQIEKGGEIYPEYTFEIGQNDLVGCFLLDSFLNMQYLNCPVVK